jgi:hypothetical protein
VCYNGAAPQLIRQARAQQGHSKMLTLDFGSLNTRQNKPCIWKLHSCTLYNLPFWAALLPDQQEHRPRVKPTTPGCCCTCTPPTPSHAAHMCSSSFLTLCCKAPTHLPLQRLPSCSCHCCWCWFDTSNQHALGSDPSKHRPSCLGSIRSLPQQPPQRQHSMPCHMSLGLTGGGGTLTGLTRG